MATSHSRYCMMIFWIFLVSLIENCNANLLDLYTLNITAKQPSMYMYGGKNSIQVQVALSGLMNLSAAAPTLSIGSAFCSFQIEKDLWSSFLISRNLGGVAQVGLSNEKPYPHILNMDCLGSNDIFPFSDLQKSLSDGLQTKSTSIFNCQSNSEWGFLTTFQGEQYEVCIDQQNQPISIYEALGDLEIQIKYEPDRGQDLEYVQQELEERCKK